MRKIITLLSCLVCLQLSAQITTYNINRSIKCTDTIQPFATNANSYGISIDGEGLLLSDTAFIRVVLVDNNDDEWLVYERNSLFATEEGNQFQDAAFETAALNNINPKSIIVTLCDASFYLASITNNRTFSSRNDVLSASDSVFLIKNLQIVDRINAKLTANKKAWRADTTFLSNLRYQEKKAMFGNDLPNLQGWDYYAYGYYSPLGDNTPSASDNIVKEFDWRTRHGSQNTGTYYYNHDSSGWIPRWRYGQGAGHPDCWAFSTLYSVESMVNLYFNQQINDELSVQDILSCSDGKPLGPGSGHGGVTDTALIYAAREGIVNDSCFGYITWLDTVPCERKCSNPSEIVKIGGSVLNLFGEELIKRELITKGPLVCSVIKWGHAMSMVGFGVVKAGDPIMYGNFHIGTVYDIYVEEDSPDIGKPYYIFKQSYATYGYDNSHFCNIIIDANNGAYLKCRSIDTPITSLLYDDNDIVCADNDGDGYYNWGIGPKPATCPNCPDEEDCDDSSPLIGPYNDKYECMILCENYVYSSTPEYITGQTLWGSETYIDHDVIVESGGALTIKSTVYMGESTKIIVKPGGRLILDYRAVLTGMCGSMWQGIEVWGNSSTHQFEVNGSYGQGYLEMKNGATIENAICAVELWRPGHWSTTGGIIHATDATFKNNATSIHALCYTNYNPSNYSEEGYNAVFNNCSFVVDEDYLGTETFSRHVILADVYGIRFLGCDFSAKRGVTGVNQWCVGINAYDANFTVNSLCTSATVMPCTGEYLKKPTFTGLCCGIRASSNGNHPRSFTVREAVFMNNDRGIHAIGTGFPTILMNEFNISRNNTYCLTNYGIILEDVTGFCIEENSFQPVPGAGGTTVGMSISNSYGINDIYLNSFTGLSQANLAIGKNKINTAGGVWKGLTYTCNDFSHNGFDLMVLKEDGFGDIQPLQGSPNLSAGNTFHNSTFQIHNDGNTPITYYYNSNNPDESPDPTLINNVYLYGRANSNACHSHYGNGPVVRSAQEKVALESEYLTAYSSYLNLKQLYDSRIDGGSTPTQLADINAATPADLWELRAQLLGLSPYVSRQVLAAAADRDDVFTNPVLFEILAANPDELRSDSLISYLENKEHPLPDYMIDLLMQIAGGTTARTAMVAQMNKLWHDCSLAAGDIVRSNLNDSVSNPAELRNWLGNMNDIAADRMAISSYIQEGDSTSAFTLAGMLPDLYGLQGDELEDQAGYMRLIQLYQTLNRSGRNVYELTETETAEVDSIAENGVGVSRLMAQSLREQVTGVMTETCLDHSDLELPGRGKAAIDDSSMNRVVGFTASVSPNPATTWVVVDYTLPSMLSKATVILTNTLGVTVMSTELNGTQGQKVLDLRGLPVGVYLYTIHCGSYMETGKLVVTQ